MGGFWPFVKTMRARSSWTAITRSRRSVSDLRPMSATSRSAPTAVGQRPAATMAGTGSKSGHSPTAVLRNSSPIRGYTPIPLFSPDGRWLATNLGNELCLWTVGEWREGPRFEGGGLSFSPDGRLLAIAQRTGSVRLVEVVTGRLVASLDDPQQSRSRQATFTADGSRLDPGQRATAAWPTSGTCVPSVASWSRWASTGTGRRCRSPRRDDRPRARFVSMTDLGGHDFSWGGSDPQEIDRLNEALEIDPGDRYAMVRRGRIYIDMGRYDQAIADYTRALTIRPGDPRILAGRGQAYLRKKQFALGFADCEASLAAAYRIKPRSRILWHGRTPPHRRPARPREGPDTRPCGGATGPGDRELSQHSRCRTLPRGAIPRGSDRARYEPRDRESPECRF